MYLVRGRGFTWRRAPTAFPNPAVHSGGHRRPPPLPPPGCPSSSPAAASPPTKPLQLAPARISQSPGALRLTTRPATASSPTASVVNLAQRRRRTAAATTTIGRHTHRILRSRRRARASCPAAPTAHPAPRPGGTRTVPVPTTAPAPSHCEIRATIMDPLSPVKNSPAPSWQSPNRGRASTTMSTPTLRRSIRTRWGKQIAFFHHRPTYTAYTCTVYRIPCTVFVPHRICCWFFLFWFTKCGHYFTSFIEDNHYDCSNTYTWLHTHVFHGRSTGMNELVINTTILGSLEFREKAAELLRDLWVNSMAKDSSSDSHEIKHWMNAFKTVSSAVSLGFDFWEFVKVQNQWCYSLPYGLSIDCLIGPVDDRLNSVDAQPKHSAPEKRWAWVQIPRKELFFRFFLPFSENLLSIIFRRHRTRRILLRILGTR